MFANVGELIAAEGEHLGTTEWFIVDQNQIDEFGRVTRDLQWVHVDPHRAAAGPFGCTIAHGYLTLSLLPMFLDQLYRLEGMVRGVNYGLNRVRFPAPVPVDSRLRASAELSEVTELDGGAQLVIRATVEREGAEKPVCVAELVSRNYVRTSTPEGGGR